MNAVQTAQARAAISSFLSNTPGRHLAAAVADGIKAAFGLSLSAKSAGTLMAAMAKQRLIPQPLSKNNKKLWCWREEPTPTPAPAPITKQKQDPIANLPEIEIALGRTTLIIRRDQFDTVMVGLNELTGRIRIIINT